MPRKKKEVPADNVKTEDIIQSDDEAVQQVEADYAMEMRLLDYLTKLNREVPDDKPTCISMRDQAVLHLLAGADLHRVGEDVVEHRIKRCISIANLVVKMLGEDA